MCNITVYSEIGYVENTRLMDVVDEMSRDDWWVKPLKPTPRKPTPMHPTAAATVNIASTLFATTNADTGSTRIVVKAD